MTEAGAEDRAAGLSARAMLRKHAAVLVTLCLFVAGALALYRLLAPLDMRTVIQELRATPWHAILGALAASAAGYAALIGYDWSALSYIGKRLPLPTVILGGFLGYAFGNTIGLSAVSGGAVRYRIYSALGLDAFDVAAIATFAATAYGIGSTLLGLGALAWHPQALTGIVPMDPETLRLWSLAGLAGSTGVLLGLALRGGALRLGRFTIRAPRIRELIRQMAFTVIEILAAALVLYMLLPSGSLPYANLLVVYAVASMAGVVSHVPGGVGVFESVVIAALPASVPVDQAVTGLLLFRLIYFLLPFVIALAGLSLVELWTAAGRRVPAIEGLKPVLEAGRGIIPTAAGALVLASGLFMMFAGLLPNPRATVEELETILPLALIEGNAMVSSILGSFLTVLSISVFRRSRLAYWIVLGLLATGVAVAATISRDPERVAVLAAMALILLPCRREFYRSARLLQGAWSVQWVGFMLSVLAALSLTYVLVQETPAGQGTMWWRIGEVGPGAEAWRALLAGVVVLSSLLLFAALRTARIRMREPDAAALNEAAAVLDAWGRGSDKLALTGDKILMFGAAGDAVISYGVKGASWIALGAPAGSPQGREDLAWAFHDAARAAGARPVFYETPSDFAVQAIDMGLTLHKMGEEAVVPLETFSLEGSARKRLRTAHARAGRDGLSLEILSPPHDAALLAELHGISDAWLAARGAREKSFSVGRFDLAYLDRCRLAVVRLGARPVAFANLLECRATRTAAVDLMRHADEAPSGTMEYLFTELMLRLKAEGAREFSLGMVPFKGIRARPGADLWSRFGALVYQRGDRFYNFDGLRRFKDKFDPEWRPRHFCCRSVLPPAGPLADAARLISGSARGMFGR